ncbi:hypothetical protein M0R45_003405 [Rubus argutus]|uniref:Uncharacterized protein n=1 Tax=Rubus argutus TaxID=59490 RepID=A0AAW1YGU7_RUBAR
MEVGEPSPSVVAKKLWNLVRIVFFMLRKGLSKSKLLVDLHLMLKRGKLASKAIANNLIMLHTTLPWPTPPSAAAPTTPFRSSRRSTSSAAATAPPSTTPSISTTSATGTTTATTDIFRKASPLVTLPGFGKSPMVRQLRITDSPFPIKEGGDSQVDKEAEEFIKKFYKNLKLQKRTSALESPYRALRSR